ncbi:MAG: hypothetical protein AAGD32_05100 [Planctomycetota bacterium]
MNIQRIGLGILCVWLLGGLALTQALAQTPGARLGPMFEGQTSGVSFRPPAELARVDARPGEIARYSGAGTFVVRRIDLPGQGYPLDSVVEPTTRPDDKPTFSPGMTDYIAGEQVRNTAGKLLRNEVIPTANGEIGVIVLDQQTVTGRQVKQIALLRLSDNIYFQFTYTIPADQDALLEQQPDVLAAAATFSDLIDTVRLVDQRDLRIEQEDRLIRSRTLLVNWTEARLREVLHESEWVRIIQNGQDIGYTATFTGIGEAIPDLAELAVSKGEPGSGDGTGIQIGLRSRLRSDDANAVTIDAEQRMFATFDRSRERWTTLTTTVNPQGERVETSFLEEVGVTIERTKAVRDPAGVDGVRLTKEYTLTVTRGGADGNDPEVVRELPPFYLPQAYATLLPRLLPLDRQRGYLFAQWVPDRAEIMLRYIDVLEEQEVRLGTQTVTGIVIEDRIGLEGSKTRHVFDTATGRYLGSTNPEAKLLLLPATQDEVEAIWN